MGLESGTKRLERQVAELWGPVVGFFALNAVAAGSYAGLEEWPDLTLPVRQELFDRVAAESFLISGAPQIYLIHSHDIARELDITGRITESEALSYAERLNCTIAFDAQDGMYTKSPVGMTA